MGTTSGYGPGGEGRRAPSATFSLHDLRHRRNWWRVSSPRPASPGLVGRVTLEDGK